jgi:GT2 family glycosyltransferase
MAKAVGLLYDNISGNTGDVAIGLSVRKILLDLKVPFDELVPGRFNPKDYRTILVGGGYLLRPSPDFFYDKFRISGKNILNACGIFGSPDDLHYLDDYAYLSVRSTGDREKLRYLTNRVEVVPCTSMLLKDKPLRLRLRRPSLGIHLLPGTRFLDVQSQRQFAEYISSLRLNVYFLPVTHYAYDFEYMSRIAAEVPGSHVLPVLRAEEIFALVGKFDYFISSSLHGALFAYLHNVPFIAFDLEKIRFFMTDRELAQYLFRDFESMKATFESVLNSRPDYSRKVAADYSLLRRHVARIRDILETTRTKTSTVADSRATRRGNLANQLNAQVQYLQLQNARLVSDMKKSETKSRLLNRFVEPMDRLLEVYVKRGDLQSAFPEVKSGDYLRLLEWAREVVTRRHDGAYDILAVHDKWYRENEWLKAVDELRGQARSIERLESEKKALKEELARLGIAVSKRDELGSRLKYAETQLNEIKQSFGYSIMRSSAQRIDRLFPDGTRRGEFKKTVAYSLRVAASRGTANLLQQARVKIRRREFSIIEAAPLLKAKQTLPVTLEKEKKADLTRSKVGDVQLYCDYPALSPDMPAKVSDSFMVTGWAISRKGIREVRIYLDETPLGPATYHASRPDVAAAFPDIPGADLSGFRKMVTIPREAREESHLLKIVAESEDESSATVEGTIGFSESKHIEVLPSEEVKDRIRPITAKASVVILTRSPPSDFEYALERIEAQQLLNSPEIIIVNSGTDDLSRLAKRQGVRVLSMDFERFDHGQTRNYGADQAIGDYVFFMTDDAIPASKHVFADMIETLEKDERIAAASARQIPRSDADLMACQAIWGHYRMLGLDSDRVVSSVDVDSLTPEEKRRTCQIDDVCSCFRREVFLKCKYRAGLGYAEDLDLGIKLVRDGFKIAQLFSTGVIHSHNRPPSYYLKRGYVDIKTLYELLGYTSADFAGFDQHGISSLHELLDYILCLYDSLSWAVDELGKHRFQKGEIPAVFRTIRVQLTADREHKIAPTSSDHDLRETLSQAAGIVLHDRKHKVGSNPLSERYLVSLGNFEGWLSSTHGSLAGIEQEFVEALYKLLGAELGRFLGEYSVWGRIKNRTEREVDRIDRFLSEGI